MSTKSLANNIIKYLGGKNNISSAENCMTRLRVKVKDTSIVNYKALKETEGVLGLVGENEDYIQIVLGPGKVRDVMTIFTSENIEEKINESDVDWKRNKEDIKSQRKGNKLTEILKTISNIFVPMIPAFIASGVANGLGRVLKILIANGTLPNTTTMLVIQAVVELIGSGFLAYLVIFTGVNAGKEFGVNPMLGGMIGAAALDTRINSISELVGWFNEATPSDSVLSSGAGGIIGVIVGVWILSIIERKIHQKMPAVLDVSFTPLLTMFITIPLFVFIIMPITGFISVKLGDFIGFFVNSESTIVLTLTGYVLAATFLPLVLFGLHRGLTPIYTLQIESVGFTKVFPAVAMAGAGQVGAALALYLKAKKLNKKKLQSVIVGGLPAGILGIGEPLIYGVTLPLGKPFITAGLGAGFGGAYVMFKGVGSTAFSPSGILAATHILPELVLHYIIGLIISYIAAAIITYIFISDEVVEKY
ncbi:MAG: PTS transporter subunit EIIC [Helcococcus sp.]|nr:PTS transporter subunit EIIC [Helcococcus sp.]